MESRIELYRIWTLLCVYFNLLLFRTIWKSEKGKMSISFGCVSCLSLMTRYRASVLFCDNYKWGYFEDFMRQFDVLNKLSASKPSTAVLLRKSKHEGLWSWSRNSKANKRGDPVSMNACCIGMIVLDHLQWTLTRRILYILFTENVPVWLIIKLRFTLMCVCVCVCVSVQFRVIVHFAFLVAWFLVLFLWLADA